LSEFAPELSSLCDGDYAMSSAAPRAHLTASLLAARDWFPTNDPSSARRAAAERPDFPPLFCIKGGAQPIAAGTPAPHGEGGVRKFTLRLTEERRMEMKRMARLYGQSCQAFLSDALDAHMKRLAQSNL
jgi:hypothetical protein